MAADNRTRANHRYKFRAIGASSTGLRYSFAVRTVSDWIQLPAVVVEQGNPAAFKAQLARCAPVRMPWPTTTISVILHEEVCWLFCKTRQDKIGYDSEYWMLWLHRNGGEFSCIKRWHRSGDATKVVFASAFEIFWSCDVCIWTRHGFSELRYVTLFQQVEFSVWLLALVTIPPYWIRSLDLEMKTRQHNVADNNGHARQCL